MEGPRLWFARWRDPPHQLHLPGRRLQTRPDWNTPWEMWMTF